MLFHLKSFNNCFKKIQFMALSSFIYQFHFYISSLYLLIYSFLYCQMDTSPSIISQDDTIFETQVDNGTPQPDNGDEDEGEFVEKDVEVDVSEEEDKDLDEDDLQSYHKVDSVKTIASLRMKPEHLFRLQIPLCQLVAVPMVRPTLACDLKLLE